MEGRREEGLFPSLNPESVKVILVRCRLPFLLVCVLKTVANCEAVGTGTITTLTMI